MTAKKKAPKEPAKRGRPTVYRPEYCGQAIAMGMEGKSLAQMAAHFHVARSRIDDWAERHEDFREALACARAYAQDWWEQKGQGGIAMPSSEFNASLYKFVMTNRFREDYTDKTAVDHTVTVTQLEPLSALRDGWVK